MKHSKRDFRLNAWVNLWYQISEIFPKSFDAVWKDRASDVHDVVFIAFKRDFCTETPELDANCEKSLV